MMLKALSHFGKYIVDEVRWRGLDKSLISDELEMRRAGLPVLMSQH